VTYVWPVYGRTCALARWIYFYVPNAASTSPSYIIPGGRRSPVHTGWWAGRSDLSAHRLL